MTDVVNRCGNLFRRGLDVWAGVVLLTGVSASLLDELYAAVDGSVTLLFVQFAILFLAGPAVLTVMLTHAHALDLGFPSLLTDRWRRVGTLFLWLVKRQGVNFTIVVVAIVFMTLAMQQVTGSGPEKTSIGSSALFHIATSILIATGSLATPGWLPVPSMTLLTPMDLKHTVDAGQAVGPQNALVKKTALTILSMLLIVLVLNFVVNPTYLNAGAATMAPVVVTFVQAVCGEMPSIRFQRYGTT